MRLLSAFLCSFCLVGHVQAQFRHYTVHRAVDERGNQMAKAPTVFLGHGCSGIVASQTKDYVDDFSKSGYNVVVIDSLTPRGLKSVCKNLAPDFRPYHRMVEFFEVLEIISKESWHSGKAGYIGFSNGGALGLNLAGEGRGFEAIVSYYPNCGKGAVPNRHLKLPTLVHLGTADNWTPLKFCDDIRGITQRMIHDGATHAFDIRSPRRDFMGEVLEYSDGANKTARVATKAFLDKALK